MVESAAATAEHTGARTGDFAGATLVQYRRQEKPAPAIVPAEAVERLRDRIEQLGSSWTPSFEADNVEDIFREA